MRKIWINIYNLKISIIVKKNKKNIFMTNNIFIN